MENIDPCAGANFNERIKLKLKFLVENNENNIANRAIDTFSTIIAMKILQGLLFMRN